MSSSPNRLCLGCREMKPKSELIRIVRSPEGEVLFDVVGKRNGRGGYLCRDESCYNRAVKSKAFSRAFKTQISQDIYSAIAEHIKTVSN